MAQQRASEWLDRLGYSAHAEHLFVPASNIPPDNAYASELRSLLDPDGHIKATAVFDVEGVPTVCFIDPSDKPAGWVDAVRQRIWNQNLVSVVLTIEGDKAVARSPLARIEETEAVYFSDASRSGRLSAPDIQSGDIWLRHKTWFEPTQRVDEHLLGNLGIMVERMTDEEGLDLASAQFLLGQTLFVSYLEHRGIVSDWYRDDREVGKLHELIAAKDRRGLKLLFDKLKIDFNGDFLDPSVAKRAGWLRLGDGVLDRLDKFLSRVDLATGQDDLWNYDFRFIPVELLSGIYETFLGDDQEALGAYYTPRHLANVIVDLAFHGREKPWEESVYDGACGSGILLTTAFRRMLAAVEINRGTPLTFKERCKFLADRIFGGDVSEPACRVTTFSLYLSLLEDLVPGDIALLMSDSDIKLPPLLNKNIHCGDKGDFFSENNPVVRTKPRICISNPPWREPALGENRLSYERWLKSSGRQSVRRQIAGAYAQRAADIVDDDGRIVLVLPISLLLAPTSEPFIRDWLRYVRPEVVVNFGDLRMRLFAQAKHGCAVVVCSPRRGDDRLRIPVEEVFQYWTPKVDVSLAFGRLALHTGDRHKVQTQAWWENPLILRVLAWGSREDLGFISGLQLKGTLGELASRGWLFIKGFNRTRRGSPKLSVEKLAKMPYLNARSIPRASPVLPKSALERFPKKIETVVSYGSHNGRAFHGPRVLFPDGLSDQLQTRAVYTDRKATFQHTIGAICGQEDDEDILRFVAAYLRSKLASYFILHTAFSPSNERERISVQEVEGLPFVHPDDHPDTKAAWGIVKKVAQWTRDHEAAQDEALSADWDSARVEREVFRYFGLTEDQKALVTETAEWALPSRQESDAASLLTPWQAAPVFETIDAYTSALKRNLEAWRDATGGTGTFSIKTAIGGRESGRGLGIVEITLTKRATDNQAVRSRGIQAVQAVVDKLTQEAGLSRAASENLYLSADYLVIWEKTAYFVKPLVNRLWRRSQAARDARMLVEESTGTGA